MDERTIRTVLVVDDDESVLAGCRRSLSRTHQVFTATNCEDARRLASEHPLDLAIVDLHLGHTSGVQLIRELKATQPKIFVALLSGFVTIDSAVIAAHAGADVVLTKPALPREIVRRVEAGLPMDADMDDTPTLAEATDAHMARVLDACNGNISEAARRLGIFRSTLQRRRLKRAKN